MNAHAAHLLAARLRRRGAYAAGKDIMDWPARTTDAARIWLKQTPKTAGPESWRTFMRDDLPPTPIPNRPASPPRPR
jgi:hypothetical protein